MTLLRETRFQIILSVFLFLTCIGFPMWYWSTGATRVALHLPPNQPWTNLPLTEYSAQLLNLSRPYATLNDYHRYFFDQSALVYTMPHGSRQTIHWRDQWVAQNTLLARQHPLMAKCPMWLDEQCLNQSNSFHAVHPVPHEQPKSASVLRVQCKHDEHDDAVFLSKRGDMTLYTKTNAFARRLDQLGRSLLRPAALHHTDIKHLKKISLHLVNLHPDAAILNLPHNFHLKNSIFINRLKQVFGDIQVHQENLYYGHIPGWPSTNAHQHMPHNVTITARDMEYLLNENSDWKFEAPNDPHNQLHLLILVTPHLSNLTLLDYDGKPSPLNAYTIPRWGAVTFFTEDNLTDEHLATWRQHLSKKKAADKKQLGFFPPAQIQLDLLEMHPFMEIMTSQLRSMLGIVDAELNIRSSPELQMTFKVDRDTRCGIAEWELLLFKRQKTLHFAYEAAQSLSSLLNVVQDMPDVMVVEEVAALALQAWNHLQSANQLAQQAQWNEAVLMARLAFEKAEEAFFHPSMVSLLYFPDSQKLAVYLPFVLPISITVFIALVKELKEHRNRSKEKKEKTE